MVQTVKIRKVGNKIKVNFSYNSDLVDIMREHHGYFYRKEKAWVFSSTKQQELSNILTKKLYTVTVVKENGQTTIPTEHTSAKTCDDDAFVLVLGHCKKCKQWHFLGKNGLCVQCV